MSLSHRPEGLLEWLESAKTGSCIGQGSTGRITAPVLDITHIPCLGTDDLVSLHFDYPNVLRIDNVLARMGDRSLVAEVHRFRHIKRHSAEFDTQMKTLESEMWGLQTRQRQCIHRLKKADVLQRIDKERGQDIQVVPSWAWEDQSK